MTAAGLILAASAAITETRFREKARFTCPNAKARFD
jgi:hypothetical protein